MKRVLFVAWRFAAGLAVPSLRFVGIQGALQGSIIDGPIRADSLAGRTALSTVNGRLALSYLTGVVEARSASGDIELQNLTATVVTAESYSGSITYAGSLATDQSSFATHSGNITLRLPANTGATLFLTAVRSTRLSVGCGSDAAAPRRSSPIVLGSGVERSKS